MSTFADIKKAAETNPVVFNDASVPAGHFGATTTIDSRTTVFLLEGDFKAPDAVIKGRVILVPDPTGQNPGTLAVYKGDGLRDGDFIMNGYGGHEFDTNFSLILK
jgi:hypothetical protein